MRLLAVIANLILLIVFSALFIEEGIEDKAWLAALVIAVPVLTICALLLISGASWSGFRRQPSRIEGTPVQEATRRMLERSVNAKISAWVSVLLMSGLAVFTIFLFADGAAYLDPERIRYYSGFETSELVSENRVLKRELEELRKEKTDKELDAEVKKAELDLKKAEIESRSNQTMRIITLITSSITRVGAVLVAIYLIQILLSVMRYSFRMADHIAATAEALSISSGNPDQVKQIMAATSFAHIDFGKSPASPSSELTETAKNYLQELSSIARSGKRASANKAHQPTAPASGGHGG